MIVEPDFLDHPKTVKLCRLLATDAAPMLVLRLWAHCQQRRTDNLGTDTEDIAAICRWTGDTATLIDALARCRWIIGTPEGYIAHGWRDINAAWLSKVKGGKTRAENAARNDNGQVAASSQPAEHDSAGSTAASSGPASVQLVSSYPGGEEGRGGERSGEEKSGGGGDNPPPPDFAEIPTVKEVIAFGERSGIPADYCTAFHAKTDAKGQWLNQYGRLKNWHRNLITFWGQDRPNWKTAAAPKQREPEQFTLIDTTDKVLANMERIARGEELI